MRFNVCEWSVSPVTLVKFGSLQLCDTLIRSKLLRRGDWSNLGPYKSTVREPLPTHTQTNSSLKLCAPEHTNTWGSTALRMARVSTTQQTGASPRSPMEMIFVDTLSVELNNICIHACTTNKVLNVSYHQVLGRDIEWKGKGILTGKETGDLCMCLFKAYKHIAPLLKKGDRLFIWCY